MLGSCADQYSFSTFLVELGDSVLPIATLGSFFFFPFEDYLFVGAVKDELWSRRLDRGGA